MSQQKKTTEKDVIQLKRDMKILKKLFSGEETHPCESREGKGLQNMICKILKEKEQYRAELGECIKQNSDALEAGKRAPPNPVIPNRGTPNKSTLPEIESIKNIIEGYKQQHTKLFLERKKVVKTIHTLLEDYHKENEESVPMLDLKKSLIMDKGETSIDLPSAFNALATKVQTQHLMNEMLEIKIEGFDIWKETVPVKELNSLKQKQSKLQKDIQEKEDQIAELKEKALVQQPDKATMDLQRKVEHLSMRLSKEMSSKISSDESALENVGIKNRPMNIVTEYEQVLSTSWFHAKQFLDEKAKKTNEEDRVSFLCHILKVSEDVLKESIQEVWNICEAVTEQPLATLNFWKNGKKDEKPNRKHELPENVKNGIGDYMRHTADGVNTEYTKQLVVNDVQKSFNKFKGFMKNKEISAYIQESSRLCWKMSIQRPPMEFDFPKTGTKHNPQKEELYWTSRPDKKASIKAVVHPGLVHGNRLMHKGKVFVS